eukprot:c22916_g1_i1 orf=230-1546(+)
MDGGENSKDPPIQPPPVKRVPIFIPSHAEVLQQSRPQAPPSLFQPSLSASSLTSSSTDFSPHTPPSNLSTATTHQITPPITDGAATNQPETFTQAFSFVKKTEFYSPPPAAPAPAPVLPPTTSATSATGSAASSAGGLGPKTDAAAIGQARNAILVSRRQQGNPVLKHIKNVRWIYADIVPDYIVGQSSCALYLSLRYHLLHPDYLYFRIRELLKSFRLRIILCFVDVEDVVKPLHEVTKTALLHDCSLLCAWSLEECARYLETIKIYENKPADIIQERTDHDYLSRLTSALTTIRHVNKTDVLTLGTTFGTLAATMGASMEELARCPGIGERKVKRLHDAFHEPFRRTLKQARLSDVGLTASNKGDSHENGCEEQLEGDAQQDGSAGQAGVQEASKNPAPESSVRKALYAVYEKHGARLGVQKSSNEPKSPAGVEDE